MTVCRMHHVGVIVEDLERARSFFTELGLDTEGTGSIADAPWADRVVGLEGIASDIVMMRTPDGQTRLELSRFRSPESPDRDSDPPPNLPGLRHLAFEVEDLDDVLARLRGAHGAQLVGQIEQYEDVYRMCYLRGPDGIIVELAQPLAHAEPGRPSTR